MRPLDFLRNGLFGAAGVGAAVVWVGSLFAGAQLWGPLGLLAVLLIPPLAISLPVYMWLIYNARLLLVVQVLTLGVLWLAARLPVEADGWRRL